MKEYLGVVSETFHLFTKIIVSQPHFHPNALSQVFTSIIIDSKLEP